MRRHRKPKDYATTVLREKIETDIMQGDIVSETVEEALATKRKTKERDMTTDWFY